MNLHILLDLFDEGLSAEVMPRLAGLFLQLLLYDCLSGDTCVVSAWDEESFIA